MSTWRDDLKKADPLLYEARRIAGNGPGVPLRNMIKALEMSPWLNSADDGLRLIAAKFVQSPKSKTRRDEFAAAFAVAKKNPRREKKGSKVKRKFSPAQIAAQKLFAKRAKAGTLRKASKKNPRKRVKAVHARKCRTKKLRRPRVRVLKVNPAKRATRRNPLPKKWVIRGRQKKRDGYLYYYLHPDNRFHSARKGAASWAAQWQAEKKMREILDKLPRQIDLITLERVK